MSYEIFQAMLALIALTPAQLEIVTAAATAGQLRGNDIPGKPGQVDVNLPALLQAIAKATA